MMITVYLQGKNYSNKRALSWFNVQNIEILKYNMYRITKERLCHILSLTDCGFSEILKNRSRADMELKKKLLTIQNLNFNESINFIIKHPEVLKSPIIYEENKLLVGYNSEEIRKFIPKRVRKVVMNNRI